MTSERALTSTEIETPPTPREALARVAAFPGRVLLESADGAGVSILSAQPLETLRAGAGATVTGVTERVGTSGETIATYGDPFAGLAAQLSVMASSGAAEVSAEVGATASGGHAVFRGGLIGFLGYEVADVLESLPAPPLDDVGMPDAWFGLYDHAMIWDHGSGRCFGVTAPMRGLDPEGAGDRLRRLVAAAGSGGAGLGSYAPGATAPPAPAMVPDAAAGPDVTSSLDRAAYMAGVARIQELIRAGDLFQANLTRRISARTDLRADVLYDRLVEASAGGLSAFVDVGAGAVASVSPELFLSVRGRRIVTRPIKGTAPRGATQTDDERLARALLASEKDAAENVMIVDLLRNDLSRVCRAGSVQVESLNELETHPTVHHLVSTVEGELASEVGVVDVLRATFPGGSVTGAPKIRAMAALRELEPVRRGVYTGAIGILGRDGSVDLSVAIRTAVVRNGYAHYGTGGGITLASDPASEWDESEVKAAAFRQALGIR